MEVDYLQSRKRYCEGRKSVIPLVSEFSFCSHSVCQEPSWSSFKFTGCSRCSLWGWLREYKLSNFRGQRVDEHSWVLGGQGVRRRAHWGSSCDCRHREPWTRKRTHRHARAHTHKYMRHRSGNGSNPTSNSLSSRLVDRGKQTDPRHSEWGFTN